MTEQDPLFALDCEIPSGPWTDVIDFWFGAPGDPARGEMRMMWWGADENTRPEEFDAQITERFLTTYEAAMRRELDSWRDHAPGILALIVCLDQFPRNMFRGTARAFEADAIALAAANHAIEQGYDLELRDFGRQFAYMPLQHAEDLDCQRRCLELFTELGGERRINFAQHHYDIIARFGRFPHRNEVMGRASTPEEIEYIKDPDNRFGQ